MAGDRKLGKPALSLAIGGGLVYLLYAGGLPLVPKSDLPAPAAVLGYGACLFAMHVFRASRWRHLLRPLGEVSLRTVIATAWLGFAAVMFMPLRTGEVVRPLALSRRSRIGGWEAAGTVGAERVIDGLVLSAILALGLAVTTPLDPLPERVGDLALPVRAVPAAATTALVIFVAALGLVAAFHRHQALGARLVAATVGRLSARLGARFEAILGAVARGLDFLPSTRLLAPFLLETMAYWALNALGLWCLALGSGLEAVGFFEACVVMGCLGIGILTPSAPGYFGTFQLSVYLALALYLPPEQVIGRGASFVFVAFLGQIAVHAVCGLVGAFAERAGDLAPLSDTR